MFFANTGAQHLLNNANAVKKALDLMDIKWDEVQKQLKNKRLEEKCAKRQHHNDFVTKLLTTCKSWGGPCTSKQELLSVLQNHPDNVKLIIGNELAYYIHTHPNEHAFHPEMF